MTEALTEELTGNEKVLLAWLSENDIALHCKCAGAALDRSATVRRTTPKVSTARAVALARSAAFGDCCLQQSPAVDGLHTKGLVRINEAGKAVANSHGGLYRTVSVSDRAAAPCG